MHSRRTSIKKGKTVETFDVFISYKREERLKVEKIVNALRSTNIKVWYDHDLEIGSSIGFNTEVEQQIEHAKVAIVCWSKKSKDSIFVKAEALKALELNKLSPLFLDQVELPIPFNALHTEDLSNWKGDRNAPEWIKFSKHVSKKIMESDVSTETTTANRSKYMEIIRRLTGFLPTESDQTESPKALLKKFLDNRWEISALLFTLEALIPNIPPKSEGYWRQVLNSGHFIPEEKDALHAIQSLGEVKKMSEQIASIAKDSLAVLHRAQM